MGLGGCIKRPEVSPVTDTGVSHARFIIITLLSWLNTRVEEGLGEVSVPRIPRVLHPDTSQERKRPPSPKGLPWGGITILSAARESARSLRKHT